MEIQEKERLFPCNQLALYDSQELDGFEKLRSNVVVPMSREVCLICVGWFLIER